MEVLIAIAITYGILAYMGFAFILFRRLGRVRSLPRERRQRLGFREIILALYGMGPREARVEPLERVDELLNTFRGSTQQLEAVMAEIEDLVGQRRRALQEAERELHVLETEQQKLTERIEVLRAEDPQAVRIYGELLEQALSTSQGRTLRQQAFVSALFFLLGTGTSALVAVIVAG